VEGEAPFGKCFLPGSVGKALSGKVGKVQQRLVSFMPDSSATSLDHARRGLKSFSWLAPGEGLVRVVRVVELWLSGGGCLALIRRCVLWALLHVEYMYIQQPSLS
jgi:hypothetical protein